jgi:hypothetical protein
LSFIGLWIRMEGGFNACGPNFNRAISGSCRTRTDCPQAAHLIGQSPVKLGSSDCPIRVAYGASGLGRCDGHHEMVDFPFRKRHGGLLRIRRERPSAERQGRREFCCTRGCGCVAAPDACAKIGNANGASAERDCSLDDHQRPS